MMRHKHITLEEAQSLRAGDELVMIKTDDLPSRFYDGIRAVVDDSQTRYLVSFDGELVYVNVPELHYRNGGWFYWRFAKPNKDWWDIWMQ